MAYIVLQEMKESYIDPVARRRSLIAIAISIVALVIVISDSPESLHRLKSAFLLLGINSLAVLPMILLCALTIVMVLRLPRFLARRSAKREADSIE